MSVVIDALGGRRWAAVALALVAFGAAPALGQAADEYAGRPLADVLRALQAGGLRIVFSSALVPSDLRVRAAPRAREPRRRLDELLAPHGLAARDGPGGTIQIVRIRRGRASDNRAADPPADERGGTGPQAPLGGVAHRERVIVREPPPTPDEGSAAVAMSLKGESLARLNGALSDDPVRLAQAFPGVWAADDFRSEFSVRGSPFRHVGVVVDGASTSRLLHVAPGRGAGSSMGMLAAQVLEAMTLQSGAYPRRHADTLGAELHLTIREGSRATFGLRGALTGTSALVVGEGPLGSPAGSWLIAARRSYVEWPAGGGPQRAPLGFSDVVGKAVYDIDSRQQVSVSVVSGLSGVDGEDAPGVEAPDDTSRAALVNVAWRSTIGRSVVLTQRAYLVRQSFAVRTGEREGGDRHDEMVYRATVLRPIGRGLVEAGAQIGRAERRQFGTHGAASANEAAWTRSAFAHVRWLVTPAFHVAPGVRVSESTLADRPAVSRWLIADWEFRRGWALHASAGVSRQFPALSLASATAEMPGLPERARHADVGIEQQLAPSLRWRAALFDRRESDIAQHLEPEHRRATPFPGLVAGRLRGTARGIELLIERQSPRGLAGWATYSFGAARMSDVERAETFQSDADRRHTLSVWGAYRFSDRSGVEVVVRAGSNVPIPGYVVRRGGQLFAGPTRNSVRLPTYARVDVRAHRGVAWLGLRMTTFAELINLLDRDNLGPADGTIDLVTGAATGFTAPLAGRRATAGIAMEF